MAAAILVTTDIWSAITARAKRCAERSYAAVAYFGTGGAELLPLCRGSMLIVDCSRRAVTSGQTNPSALLKLINAGVEIHSVENLHAKVFVLGGDAFIGSTNVSTYSAKTLVEAVLRTSDRRVVKQCRNYVQSLAGERITPKHAQQLAKIYRPPRFLATRSPKTEKLDRDTPAHAPTWAVPLVETIYDLNDEENRKRGLPMARKRLKSGRNSEIDEFVWGGKAFLELLREGHLVITVTQIPSGDCMVSQAARIIYIQRYRVRREHRAIVFLETLKGSRRRHIDRVVSKFGRAANPLTGLTDPIRLRDEQFVHQVLNFWK